MFSFMEHANWYNWGSVITTGILLVIFIVCVIIAAVCEVLRAFKLYSGDIMLEEMLWVPLIAALFSFFLWPVTVVLAAIVVGYIVGTSIDDAMHDRRLRKQQAH